MRNTAKEKIIKKIGLFVVVLLSLYLAYRLFTTPEPRLLISVFGIIMTITAIYSPEDKAKRRPYDLVFAVCLVAALSLFLIDSGLLYSILNIALSPISTITRFVLVLFAGVLTLFVSMMCNDLYPNFMYLLAKQGEKPARKPLRVWIVFLVLTSVAAVCSSIAAVAPAK